MDVKLVMFREDGSRRAIPILPGRTTIGRRNECTIRIPLSEVSRRHAEINLDGDTLVLVNAGASNGTFLNNRRIETQEEMEPGDQITIGPVVFTVQINGQPADDEMVAVRTKVSLRQKAGQGGAGVGASRHVYISDEEIDPIAALEALASSADQTAINAKEDDFLSDDEPEEK